MSCQRLFAALCVVLFSRITLTFSSEFQTRYLGKVRSNFYGTEFLVYNDGENPEHYRGNDEDQIRKELGAVS